MELEQQIVKEMMELKAIIQEAKQQRQPRHLIKMYESMLKAKEHKLRMLFHTIA